MPFFPRFHYPQTSSASSGYPIFPTDILRMLDDFESAGSESGHGNQNRSRRAFSPNFDVHETAEAYILEGELPGLEDKKNVTLEFTDDKTLMVSGRIERSWSSGTPPSKAVEGAAEQKKIGGGEENAKDQSDGAEKKEENKKEQQKKSDVKYWVSERSVGEFSRSFSFPGNVDIDKVKASLEHGVLKIVVPKMEKKGARRIELS